MELKFIDCTLYLNGLLEIRFYDEKSNIIDVMNWENININEAIQITEKFDGYLDVENENEEFEMVI